MDHRVLVLKKKVISNQTCHKVLPKEDVLGLKEEFYGSMIRNNIVNSKNFNCYNAIPSYCEPHTTNVYMGHWFKKQTKFEPLDIEELPFNKEDFSSEFIQKLVISVKAHDNEEIYDAFGTLHNESVVQNYFRQISKYEIESDVFLTKTSSYKDFADLST